MISSEPAKYKLFDQYKYNFLGSKQFYFILAAWIVGMLLISSLAVSLMILSVSSIASKIPKPNKTHFALSILSRSIPMQPNVRPLKLPNHKITNMPQLNITPATQHETLQLLERLEVQPNYYNSRNTKGKLMLPPPVWRLARLPDSTFERFPADDRSSFSSQIPRPPRLTRTMSENRRHYMEGASEVPRPFNFPLDGPQPSQFKKSKDSKKEKKVNNIQDILRQEHVLGASQYRMPVGIHISGSFKNLQNSGISNVFRKYVQVQPQVAPSQFSYQRIAFDPFFPFKPKSLNEINSLAMKQLGLNRSKKKNKKNMIPALIFQQSGHRPVSTDYFMDAMRLNNSMKSYASQPNLKTEPFSLKLEVFPIRTGKKVPLLPPMPAPQFLTTVRPNAANFEPFYPQIGVPYGLPIDFNYAHNNPPPYKGRFPPQSPSLYSGPFQREKLPSDTNSLASPSPDAVKSPTEKKTQNSNQLMVHLNVFPSKKDNPVPQNHLYDVIHADVHDRSSAEVKNETAAYVDCESGERYDDETEQPFDYQHRIVVKDAPRSPDNFADMTALRPVEVNLNGTVTSSVGEKLSTFRFPVENLMQFQANDAVI